MEYYLNPKASINGLSQIVGFSSNYVSQVINQKLGISFPELLTKHRIEKAKEILSDNSRNVKIEEIAYSLGYNSKSTFHSAFKRITGKTPAEYRQNAKE